jgi:hypothetical protein
MKKEELERLREVIEQTNLQLTVSDAREYFGGCIPGWNAFSLAHGFDWKQVVRHGLSARDLLSTKDSMAIGLVIYKYKLEKLL